MRCCVTRALRLEGFTSLIGVLDHGPTGSFVTAVHNVLYDLRIPSLGRLVQLAVLGFGTFFLGASLFNRLSPRFAEEM